MDNNIPRNTPALLGTNLLLSNKYHSRTLTRDTARIDQLRNSLFNRFEKLLEQAHVSDENEHQVTAKGYCRCSVGLAFER
jgi:hypothetical protein